MYNLQTVKLGYGAHPDNEREKCAMEAVAFLAGEKHTDAPKCVCPVIAAYTRIVNDWFTQKERDQHLLPMLFDFMGTKVKYAHRRARARLAVNYSVKVFLPHALSAAGCPREAEMLRGLPDIVGQRTSQAAYDALLDPMLLDMDTVLTTRKAVYYAMNFDAVGDVPDAAETAALATAELIGYRGVDRSLFVAETIKCLRDMLEIGSRVPVESVRSLDELACAMTAGG